MRDAFFSASVVHIHDALRTTMPCVFGKVVYIHVTIGLTAFIPLNPEYLS